jgi:hypothetical protein
MCSPLLVLIHQAADDTGELHIIIDCAYLRLCARVHNRKNWLHVGSPQSGPKVASILSVVESCRRLGVPIKKYLAAILPGLNQRTLSQVANLTPARWAASRG